MAVSPYETQAIYNLQRYLRQLSRFDADIPSVDEDGIFGPATQTALIIFQDQKQIPATGTCDALTWAELVKE